MWLYKRRFLNRSLLTCVIAATVLCGGARMAHSLESTASELDQQFLAQAPRILEFLRSKGYRNVGVLKFRIKKGHEPVSDSVGALNTLLTNRLEVALVLANSSVPEKQVGIIHDASAIAATIPGAGHVSAAGREKLFGHKYPLAWGQTEVTPDAFLTGIVQVSPDLAQMAVGILVFDHSGGSLEKAMPPFTVTTAATQVNELGESFLLRGAFDGANVKVKPDPVATAANVRTQAAIHPLADPQSPVSLEVLYDELPQRIEFRDGKAFVQEPQEGQNVKLVLKHQGNVQERLAVVLKVNGENTLYREKLPDLNCRKWILEPGAPPITLVGYQSGEAVAETFRVLSSAESRISEVNYGTDVGMISLTVFQEKGRNVPPPDLPDDEAEDLAALTRGAFPQQRPKNLSALKAQLREGGRGAGETRGLIQQGQQTASLTRTVKFDAEPTPVMSAAVIYYTP